MNENHTTLKLFDFSADPAELSRWLGLDATKTARKGDERPAIKARGIECTFPWNYWEYRRTQAEDRFVGDIVEEFVAEVIEPRKEILRELITACSAELSVAQYYYTGHNPGIHFSRKVLGVLEYVGAEIDVDIYCLADDD